MFNVKDVLFPKLVSRQAVIFGLCKLDNPNKIVLLCVLFKTRHLMREKFYSVYHMRDRVMG